MKFGEEETERDIESMLQKDQTCTKNMFMKDIELGKW